MLRSIAALAAMRLEARGRPHPSRRAHARACTLLRMRPERVRRTPRADECRLRPVPSQSVEAEVQAAGGCGRCALPRVRAGGDVSLCARAQIHALRCAEGKIVRAARLSRL